MFSLSKSKAVNFILFMWLPRKMHSFERIKSFFTFNTIKSDKPCYPWEIVSLRTSLFLLLQFLWQHFVTVLCRVVSFFNGSKVIRSTWILLWIVIMSLFEVFRVERLTYIYCPAERWYSSSYFMMHRDYLQFYPVLDSTRKNLNVSNLKVKNSKYYWNGKTF